DDLAEHGRLRQSPLVREADRPVAAGAQAHERALAEPREEIGDAGERVEGVGRGGTHRGGTDDGRAHEVIVDLRRRHGGRPGNPPPMPPRIRENIAAAVRAAAKERLDADIEGVVLERPPRLALGDLACPIAFDLAKSLKKAPRAIATE